jgi:hypothetical protein
MRILCAIVEPTAGLVPLGCNTDIVHRRRICSKPIGDDAARSPVFLHDPLEKLQCRGFVSLRGINPIEMAFAKLKALLRAKAIRTIDALWRAIGEICDLFSPHECRNYFAAAGYGFT